MDREAKAARERVRGRTRRWTATREKILDAALSRDGHFDVEVLHRALNRGGGRAVSRATIYRTLPLLVETGLVTPVRSAAGETRYERSYRKGHHDHLLCIACGTVLEFESPALERLQDRACRRHGFVPKRHQLVVEGHCRACAKKSRA